MADRPPPPPGPPPDNAPLAPAPPMGGTVPPSPPLGGGPQAPPGDGGWWKRASKAKKSAVIAAAMLVGLIALGVAGGQQQSPSSVTGSRPTTSAATGRSSSAPTAVETPNPTPEPTAAPTPTPQALPAVLRGRGDGVVNVPAPWNTDPALLTATNSGQSNFIVETLNTDNTTGEGIVNEIGAFSGVLPFDFTQGQSVSRLKVTSDGNWSLTFASVSTAPQFNGGFTGKGDTVLLYTGPAATMHITHSGTANFIVDAYPVDGGNQSNVVNEIGAYNGTQPIQAGPILIGITADGSFTFAPT